MVKVCGSLICLPFCSLFPYTLLPSTWELPDGLAKSFLRDVMIPLVDSHLYAILSLLPAEQKPPSKSFLNALCMSVNCPCKVPRHNQKKYRNKTCNTTGMSSVYFYNNVHFTIYKWVHVLITMLWTNDALLGSYTYRTNLVQHFRGTSEKRFGSGGCWSTWEGKLLIT